jgi:hypothetical protein
VFCYRALANLPVNAFVYPGSGYRKIQIFVKRFGRKSQEKEGWKSEVLRAIENSYSLNLLSKALL